ncbi:hypothetical protein ARMA_2321 [Ardenticatena maritima]|uniref:Uncharacterized protein n=1 Tax=Ardenticatena maritima TaxID=872965 RepID=A0A0M9UDD5_9CHLR|nr:hypothetical protein ARMA_2321 [Ardenticatena maritima]
MKLPPKYVTLRPFHPIRLKSPNPRKGIETPTHGGVVSEYPASEKP